MRDGSHPPACQGMERKPGGCQAKRLGQHARLLGEEGPFKNQSWKHTQEGRERSLTQSRIRAPCSLADGLKTYNSTGGHCAG